MKAVHSEFQMNLQQDVWRKYQLVHHLSKPGNAYNTFMIGSLASLNFPDT
jgi:insulysin